MRDFHAVAAEASNSAPLGDDPRCVGRRSPKIADGSGFFSEYTWFLPDLCAIKKA
jgi:hypothetical protein